MGKVTIEQPDKYKVIKGVKHKLCSTCKVFIPVDQFSSRTVSADGLAYSCKTCERATSAASYARKKKKKQSKTYYSENKDACIARSKARYDANSIEILQQQAVWRASKDGQKIMSEAAARRRKRIKDQTPGGCDYTRIDVIERDMFEGSCICQICGHPIIDIDNDLQIDHIKTIAAGGSDTFDNVRSAHKNCNLRRPKNGSDV